jgi:2-dehydropantoate 2-reductase
VRLVRFVVYGAGAIGGVVGGRLARHGHDVVLIARGAHCEAIRADGLRVVAPDGATATLAIPVVSTPAAVEFEADDVVLLAMKSQHTRDALDALAAVAPPGVAVVAVQNGVANERAALRRFADVYGVCVVCPALHLEPGVVEAHAGPIAGILDIGRYPRGVDARAEAIATALASSSFESVARTDIMRWKYAKLLNNLGNAVDALCGSDPAARAVHARARQEGVDCLAAAGIDAVTPEEDAARRGDGFRWGGAAARSRPGASSWQSLARGTGSIEADYLNGEIVMLGRLHAVPTPVNLLLQGLVTRAAREMWAPGTMPVDELIRMLPPDE